MIIVVAAIILCIIVALSIFIIKGFSSPKKVDSVKKLLKAGKNQAAAKLAKQIVTKDPNNYAEKITERIDTVYIGLNKSRKGF